MSGLERISSASVVKSEASASTLRGRLGLRTQIFTISALAFFAFFITSKIPCPTTPKPNRPILILLLMVIVLVVDKGVQYVVQLLVLYQEAVMSEGRINLEVAALRNHLMQAEHLLGQEDDVGGDAHNHRLRRDAL